MAGRRLDRKGLDRLFRAAHCLAGAVVGITTEPGSRPMDIVNYRTPVTVDPKEESEPGPLFLGIQLNGDVLTDLPTRGVKPWKNAR
jgi:hypothetical protein